MEHTRVRRSLALTGGVAPGRQGDTKGRIVSRRLRRVATAQSIVAGLPQREVGRNGRATAVSPRHQPPFADQPDRLARLPAEGRDDDRRKQYIPQPLGIRRAGQPSNLPRLEAADPEVVERARRRQEEREALKERMKSDLLALKEQEEEEDKRKQERLRRLFERERTERAEKLEAWREKQQRQEAQKKRKEERRKERQKKALEEGLRERQRELLAKLREDSLANRQTTSTPDSRREESMPARPRRQPRKERPNQRAPRKSNLSDRLNALQGQYDPSGKAVLPNLRKKPARKMSDQEIVTMARQLVESAKPISTLSAEERVAHDLGSTTSSSAFAAGPLAPSTVDASTGRLLYLSNGNQESDGQQDEDGASTDWEKQLNASSALLAEHQKSVTSEIEAWYRQQLDSVEL